MERNVETWLNWLHPLSTSGVPDAYSIWKAGRAALDSGDLKTAKLCELLNQVLHNSDIPTTTNIGKDVSFGHAGGIGVILHERGSIGDFVTIASNVTIGGGRKTRSLSDNSVVSIPEICDVVYIASGACVIGGITVGPFAIVGVNSVIQDDVPPFTIWAGNPSKQVGEITKANCLRYRGWFLPLRSSSDAEFLNLFNRYWSNYNGYSL